MRRAHISGFSEFWSSSTQNDPFLAQVRPNKSKKFFNIRNRSEIFHKKRCRHPFLKILPPWGRKRQKLDKTLKLLCTKIRIFKNFENCGYQLLFTCTLSHQYWEIVFWPFKRCFEDAKWKYREIWLKMSRFCLLRSKNRPLVLIFHIIWLQNQIDREILHKKHCFGVDFYMVYPSQHTWM